MSGPIFTAYGFTQPLIDILKPILAQRDPALTDGGAIGQLWINVPNNSAFVATSTEFISSTNRTETTWIPIGGGGDVASFNTDAGLVIPIAGVVNVLGGLNINTSGAGNILTINLNEDVTIAGNFTTTGGNISLPDTDSSGIEGIITFGGTRFIHNAGTFNTFVGANAGNLTLTGTNNVAIGSAAGNSLSNGIANVLIGQNAALNADCSGSTIVGTSALQSYTGFSSNTAIGALSIDSLIDGSFNLVIGCPVISGSGSTYTGSESNNILIQNPGVTADNNIIRIGTQGNSDGEQDTCFIAGIIGNTVLNEQLVTINSVTGQLGVTNAVTGMPWTTVTTATNMAVNTGYFVNGASILQFTLPATAAVGDVIEIRVLNTAVGGWQINQNAGQYIIGNSYGSPTPSVTTVGVTGNVAVTADQDWMGAQLVCCIADTAFTLLYASGGGVVFT